MSATCLAGCLFILEQLHLSPVYAALLALPIGFYLGRIMTRGVRNERSGR